MKVSMPEQIAMSSLVKAISDYTDHIVSSYHDSSDERLDELKFLNLNLARFLQGTRELIDFRLKEPDSSEEMLQRMEELSQMYSCLLKSIDAHNTERMELELNRASQRSA